MTITPYYLRQICRECGRSLEQDYYKGCGGLVREVCSDCEDDLNAEIAEFNRELKSRPYAQRGGKVTLGTVLAPAFLVVGMFIVILAVHVWGGAK